MGYVWLLAVGEGQVCCERQGPSSLIDYPATNGPRAPQKGKHSHIKTIKHLQITNVGQIEHKRAYREAVFIKYKKVFFEINS